MQRSGQNQVVFDFWFLTLHGLRMTINRCNCFHSSLPKPAIVETLYSLQPWLPPSFFSLCFSVPFSFFFFCLYLMLIFSRLVSLRPYTTLGIQFLTLAIWSKRTLLLFFLDFPMAKTCTGIQLVDAPMACSLLISLVRNHYIISRFICSFVCA